MIRKQLEEYQPYKTTIFYTDIFNDVENFRKNLIDLSKTINEYYNNDIPNYVISLIGTKSGYIGKLNLTASENKEFSYSIFEKYIKDNRFIDFNLQVYIKEDLT